MSFAHPALLAALALLPVLWWLLRATPPAPRRQPFPAVALLLRLPAAPPTPARTPWWLLALRLTAAALVIVGLADPVRARRDAPFAAPGPVLLAIDNGWAAAPDWPARLAAADAILERAARAHRQAALLATAPDGTGATTHAAPTDPALLRPLLAALRPMPWPTDRAATLPALAAIPPGPVAYLADTIAGTNDTGFPAALAAHGPVSLWRAPAAAPLLASPLLGAQSTPAGLEATVTATPGPARTLSILAETTDGRVLPPTPLTLPAGQPGGTARIPLPPELRNQLAALRLANSPGPGAVALLDEAARRRPVGLLDSGADTASPLLAGLFYVERALAPTAELRRGTLAGLLARPLALLILADRPLAPAEQTHLAAWVRAGGLLVRFAGPATAAAAAAPDPLLPAALLAGDRTLGGTLSWTQPQRLAPFPASPSDSPFAGLPVPPDIRVSRQVLADPATMAGIEVWSRLADGTPLVLARRLGSGETVLVTVTANADWSNLPLSGLFVAMLQRLTARAAGIEATPAATPLAPARTLDGAGQLTDPPPAATALPEAALATTPISPRHPPGLYGPERNRHALNLAGHVARAPMPPIPGATPHDLAAAPHAADLGPTLVTLAALLLLADMLAGLALAGRLRPALAAAALCLALGSPAHADPATGASPSLATHLGYIVTNDSETDRVSRLGLQGLSDFVNERSAAALAAPAALEPGRDDLSFYPLLYWPITPATNPSPPAIAALNDYMRHGGIVLIDTQTGAGTTGTAADQALRRIAGLAVPALAPLDTNHVLAHAFYLLPEFPGRYTGGTIWVQRDQDRSNDSVSPVVIGSNDWAAAWAEEDGAPLFATIPGGQRQRVLAYRFGMNLVMYALTGNYKGDQVHVPALLERLGQ